MTLTKNYQHSNTLYNHEALAQKVSWQPIQKDGTPLSNMILKSIEGTLELHLNIVSRLFYFSFIVLGVFFLMYATYNLLSYNFPTTLWSVSLGFALTGVGIYMFSKQAVPHVFDKNKNLYFKENENLEREDETPLDDIEALQIIKVKKQTELNLLLKNGQRVYVCSYDANKYESVKSHAKKISKYINKPVLNSDMI